MSTTATHTKKGRRIADGPKRRRRRSRDRSDLHSQYGPAVTYNAKRERDAARAPRIDEEWD
jgi:hypothetical protein